MNIRKVLILILVGFVVYCGLLVLESGLFETCQPAREPCILLQNTTVSEDAENTSTEPAEKQVLEAPDSAGFDADHAPATTVTLGSNDPKSGFNYQLKLSAKGAAIRKAVFSRVDNPPANEPKPLEILSPVRLPDGREILSMANNEVVFVERQMQLSLDKLHWKSAGIEKGEDGSQKAHFEAIIKKSSGEPVLNLLKTYTVRPDSYLLDIDLTVVNQTDDQQKIRFNLGGPVGISREAFRSDMRQVIAGFRDGQGTGVGVGLDTKKLIKAKGIEDRRLIKPGTNFLWLAATNKYFAAIVVR